MSVSGHGLPTHAHQGVLVDIGMDVSMFSAHHGHGATRHAACMPDLEDVPNKVGRLQF